MRLAGLFFIGGALVAGTTISDTINDASGRPVLRGSVTFTPTVAFESESNANWVSRSPVSATINAGAFTVSLEPTPSGACYNVTFSPATISPAQLAAVPTSGSPLTLSQIIGATGCSSGAAPSGGSGGGGGGSGSGATISSTTDLIKGDGTGNGIDAGIVPTNILQSTGSYSNPTWITGLAWAKLTGVPSFEVPLTFSAPLSRSTNTISCLAASASQAGCLLSADWSTFNAKQAALGFTPENVTNKDAASGYAGLTSGSLLKLAEMPTLSSSNVDSSIAKTGVDINASNQVTGTHLAAALPVNQGGTGTGSTLAGLMRGNASAMTAAELSGDCTTSGSNAVTCTKTGGVSFAPSATTDATDASNITSGTLGAARLPNPSATTLGGIESIVATAHNFLTSVSTSGIPAKAQPACGDLSDSAASCNTDATNASNISSGTLGAARLPNPSATTLGGIESIASTAHNFLTSVSTSGIPAKAQPACGDLSDSAASCNTDATNASNISSGTLGAARLPNPSATTLGGIESIASTAHNFLTSVSTSGVPAKAQPACGDLSDSVASCNTDATNASNISSGTLGAARLPNPSATTLGGIESITSTAHNFLTSVSTSGVPVKAQPACADLSDSAASCNTDATNASNITSGTLAAARLPILNQNTTGNAATATALAAAPTLCSTGQAPTGVLASGNATGCAASGYNAIVDYQSSLGSFASASSEHVVFASAVLPALPAGACFDVKARVKWTAAGTNNWHLWYGTAPGTTGSEITIYTSSNAAPASIDAWVCNQNGSQTTQDMGMHPALQNGSGEYVVGGTGSQTASATNLKIGITEDDNGSTSSTVTPVSWQVSKNGW